MNNSETAGKLLLVDDDVDVLEVLPLALHHLGAEFTAVPTGEQALLNVIDDDYAAIILDVDLGGMDGFEVARRIRLTERARITPIIFVTGRSCDSLSRRHGYQVGAVDYLLKPVEIDTLVAKLRVYLDLDSELRNIRQRNVVLAREVENEARAQAEVKVLRGMLAICAYCHRIRDEEQAWQTLESYISRRSEAQFSHGVCPICFESRVREELERSKDDDSAAP